MTPSTGTRRPRRLALFGIGAAAALLPAFPATAGAVTFDRSDFPVGNHPQSVAVGDVNRDGKPDVAVANAGGDDVTLLLGDGTGALNPATGSPFAVGHEPQSVAIGDLNRDGKPDLAVPNADDDDVSVLLGDGEGGFAPKTNFSVLPAIVPASIDIGDVNRDGKPDLAVGTVGDQQAVVLLGNGMGGFTQAGGSPFAFGGQSITTVDVNRDGKPDLVAVDKDENVTVALGNGNGGFTPASRSPFRVGGEPESVGVADLDGDGNVDLAVANLTTNNVSILLGDGQGGFNQAPDSPIGAGTSPNSLRIADLNADGELDLAIANIDSSDVTVLLGNGDAEFTRATHSPFNVGRVPFAVGIGDLNRDGEPDLAVANDRDDDVSALINTSEAKAVVDPESIDFGPRRVGSSSRAETVTVKAKGDGDVPLRLRTAKPDGDDPEDFPVSGDECSRRTLPVGTTCSLDVRFEPTAGEKRDASLVVKSNDPESPDLVALEGKGLVGDDVPRCAGEPATIIGTSNGDRPLEGTSDDDVIVGRGGQDEIDGRGGRDLVCGDDGDDLLRGRADDDRLKGNGGNDELDGDGGEDRCNGGSGNVDSARGCEGVTQVP